MKIFQALFLSFCLIPIHVESTGAFSGKDEDISTYLTMPYKKVDFGIAASLAEDQKKLPSLASGEIAIFSRGPDDRVQRLATGSRLEAFLRQPKRVNTPEILARSGGIQLSYASEMLRKLHGQGGIRVMQTDIQPSIVSASSGVASHQDITVIQSKSGHGTMQSVALERKRKTLSESGRMATKTGLKQTFTQTETGKEESMTSGKKTTLVAGKGGERSVAQKMQMKLATDRDSLLSKLRDILAKQTGNAGMLHSIDDYHDLLTKYGEDFIVALIEKGSALIGISEEGSTEVLQEKSFMPAVKELNALNTLLASNANLMKLVNRPFSESFVDPEYESRLREATIDTTYQLLPEPLYHGSTRALRISIKNTSEVPIYDMLIAFAIPANTTFTRFIDATPSEKGYFNRYMAAQDMLMMKIYRPIMPGQTFNNIVLLELNSWTVAALE